MKSLRAAETLITSPEDSSLEMFFPGGGRFFAGAFFARRILRPDNSSLEKKSSEVENSSPG
jgi:hypothetical protein